MDEIDTPGNIPLRDLPPADETASSLVIKLIEFRACEAKSVSIVELHLTELNNTTSILPSSKPSYLDYKPF